MRVLVIEDKPTVSKSIQLVLTRANLTVYATDRSEEGIDLAKIFDCDLILLDSNVPDMDWQKVLRQLRLSKVDTPVLILSGADDARNKLTGFANVADDYLTKPFYDDELIARLHAIVLRSQGHSQCVITTGPISLNLDDKTVEVAVKPIPLSGSLASHSTAGGI